MTHPMIRVGAAVVNQTPLDWDNNLANLVAAVQAARAEGVGVLCLPELCITGYGCEDAFHSPGLQRTALEILQAFVTETQGIAVSVGLPILHAGGLFNTACLIADRKILGFVGKQNLAGEGLHYEPRWFKAWPGDRRAEVEIGGERYPLGDIFFDCSGVKIGFEICEDAWVARRPGADLAVHGVDIILNPSASHFAFGKQGVRQRFVLEGSRAFHAAYVYTNLLGNEAGRAIYDGGAMIAASGELLATGPRFSFADMLLTTATVDLDSIRMQRARTGSFRPEIGDETAAMVRSSFVLPRVKSEYSQPRPAAWESASNLKEEEFARAISLGLFDYLRKSRSHGFVVSISGGADSAAVSLLSAMAVQFGVAELGIEALLKKLRYIPEIAKATDARSIVGHLVSCAYQPTRNSSDTTRNAARGVAEGIGAQFFEFDVDVQVQNYISMVSQGIGRELDWKNPIDDLALQNIQARTRGPSVWLLANLRRALLLSTSNRSEAAVGYATMDGDTCGGLSPIAGIDKAYLRQWLVWAEQQGPAGIGPLAALRAINVQAPTAELRPQESKQTDEADLMPYVLLDAVERAAIRDKKTPLEVFQRMEVLFPQYTREQLLIWIERFFRLWCRNQWKRERYAPSFHVDDENLDPKTWCRFPILSGGYERELRELRAYVNG